MIVNSLKILLIFVLLFLLSCAPRYHNFKSIEYSPNDFNQHRKFAGGNTVFPGNIYQIDSLLFKKRLNGGIGAQVVATSQFLVVPTFNRRIYFLDPETGKEITSLVTDAPITAAVAVDQSLLYFVEQTEENKLTCMNLVTGKKIWSLPVFDTQSSPLIEGDDLFIASRNGVLWKLNKFTGEKHWEYKGDGQIYATPAVDGNHIYIGNDKGEMICLDRNNGEEIWTHQAQGAVYASATIADLLYYGSLDKYLYALDKNTGNEIWKYNTSGQVRTTPVVVDGQIFFGSNDRVIYALDSFTGTMYWSYETSGIIQSSPIAVGDKIIFANSGGTLYIFNLDGTIENSFQVKGSVISSPAYLNNHVYIATKKRMLYGFGNSSQASIN